MRRFALREVTHADSEQLSALSTASADGGKIAFSPRYRVPAVDAMHPDWRRRGVAKALTRWRLERVEKADHTVVMAGIQSGDAASAANAESWATQTLGPVTVAPVLTSTRARRLPRGTRVRSASTDDAAEIAAGLTAANADVDLGPAYTAEAVEEWLGSNYLGSPMNRYLLAVDEAGQAVAGIGIEDQAKLMTLHVDRMQRSLELLNRLVKVVPADRHMRNLQVRMAWHRPGQVDVGAGLWRTARSAWRALGTALVTVVDPHSPLRKMLHHPVWLPATTVQVAVRAPMTIDPSRILDPTI